MNKGSRGGRRVSERLVGKQGWRGQRFPVLGIFSAWGLIPLLALQGLIPLLAVI